VIRTDLPRKNVLSLMARAEAYLDGKGPKRYPVWTLTAYCMDTLGQGWQITPAHPVVGVGGRKDGRS